MCTAEICREIENHFCCIDGNAYSFKVHSAMVLPRGSGQAVLQIAAYKRVTSGAPAITARLRVTATFDELARVPSLLKSALEQWLFQSAPVGVTVH